jgi:3-hydroxyisobutyrate dehydrogenase-like beta-hydroxyacid dehydrogenase
MRVAVLGLGRMGSAIAERLAEAGHELTVWNRSPERLQPFTERGIRTLTQPSEAWDHAEVCVTMLADGPALEEVALGERGLLESDAARGGVLVDMSTVSAGSSAVVAAECERRGVAFLRAPVSGNPTVVRAGNLGIIVSGPEEQFERSRGTLSDIGPNLFYVGDGERSRIVKLGLNLMLGATAELMAEALVLSEKHGIERAKMLEVMGGSAAGSPFVKYKTEPLVADDYSSTFSASLLHKDLALALEAAHEAGVPLPLTAITQQLVEGCIASGMGDGDMTVLLPRLRREAGL